MNLKPENLILNSKTLKPLWRSTIYDFPHFHSTAHELVSCYSGSALIKFGGDSEESITIKVSEGESVFIPAGVGHQRIEEFSNFECIGSYPLNMTADLQYGKVEKFEECDKRISNLSSFDIPVFD